MKKIKLNIIKESKSPVVAKTQEEKILMAWIKEMAKPKLRRGEYVGMEWSDEERNYASMDQFKGGVISAALGKIVKALDIENPPDSYREISNERLRVAEWVYATIMYGASGNATPKLRRTNNPDPRYSTLLHSDNFMSSYDTFNPYARGTLNKRGKWFIRLWRQICHFASYIVEVREGAAKYTVPRDRQGRPMSDRAFRNMMKRDVRKLSKRDRLGPIERALYDMNPDNQPSLLNDMAMAMIDPRGPWGFAGRNKDGEAINNWQAFKDSVNDLKTVDGPFELQFKLGMVALSGLGLIPFVPSPSKAGSAGARGISRAVKTTKGVNAEAALIASRIKKAAKQAEKAGEMSKAQRAKVTTKADEILAVTKHNDAVLAKYPGGKVCVKKGGLKEYKITNLNEQNIMCICPPYKIDDFGRLIDPEVNPKAYGLGPGDEILYGSDGKMYKQGPSATAAAQASRGPAQVAKGRQAVPEGLFVLNDEQIYILMKFPDGKVVPYYKSSGRSGYGVMQGRFVPAGQVELWSGGAKYGNSTRLKKVYGHPDVAAKGEILADGNPNPLDGKYIAAESELGAAGAKLDDGLGEEMMSKALADIDHFGPKGWLEGGAGMSNISKYDSMDDYGKALNSKLEELGHPKFEDGSAFQLGFTDSIDNYLTDASLNHYLVQFNATNSKFMDGKGLIPGISPKAGPTIKQMQEADKLLTTPTKAAAKAPTPKAKAVKKKGWLQRAKKLIGLEENQKRLNSLEKIIEEELERVLREFK